MLKPRLVRFVSNFHVVAKEFGHSGRPLPTWTCSSAGNVNFDQHEPNTICRDLSDFVPGAFQLLNVLSSDECEQIVRHVTDMGWDEDAPVSLPHSFRHMENVNWVAHETIVDNIWKRANRALPASASSICPGADAVGLNARFRCYRYQGGDYFKPHVDGSWPGSGVSPDRKELVWDLWPGKRWSQLTFLLLLSDGYEGGRTIFYPDCSSSITQNPVFHKGFKDVVDVKADTDSLEVCVRTPKGAALCFPHGGHPLHARHAGELVGNGAKIMIRTELLYNRTDESDKLQNDWFRDGSGQTNK